MSYLVSPRGAVSRVICRSTQSCPNNILKNALIKDSVKTNVCEWVYLHVRVEIFNLLQIKSSYVHAKLHWSSAKTVCCDCLANLCLRDKLDIINTQREKWDSELHQCWSTDSADLWMETSLLLFTTCRAAILQSSIVIRSGTSNLGGVSADDATLLCFIPHPAEPPAAAEPEQKNKFCLLAL